MKPEMLEQIREFVAAQPDGTKVYIGADSERITVNKIAFADYTLAVVVHIGGKNGCKVFGDVIRERLYEHRKDKPALRLLREVQLVAELFQELSEVLADREIEVHLDLNPDKTCGSSCVVSEAVGYIRGVCNVEPKVKPFAFAASYCADRLKDILNQ